MPLSKPFSRPSRLRRAVGAAASDRADSAFGEDLARAARILTVRSRREATGLFAGSYASAFRGGGLEFEESRPYAPGDDVRSIDWNATARAGEPFVKRFREERDQTLLFALDTSASMRFRSGERSKATTSARALSLLAAAAGRAGDRVGLLAFADEVSQRVPASRGAAHTWRVIRAAVLAAADASGGTDLTLALRSLRAQSRERSVIVLFSDFRDPSLLGPDGLTATVRAELAALSRRHDVVAGVIGDPREEQLPAVGRVRIVDPERPDRPLWLDTRKRRVRERYRAAAAVWIRNLDHELRAHGADVLHLRCDRDPLFALGRFFRDRARRIGVAA